MTESPFVRNSAVVRCASCNTKYRIKSSHVERVLTSGPRTLDETDHVLRTDSVDIDPDEASPVSIDDAGNVVGLSGLSELMRQSDAKGAKAKLQSHMKEAPPAAKTPRSASADQSAGAITRLDDEPATTGGASQRRAKLLARKRQMRTNAMIIAALTCLLVVSGVVLFMLTRGGKDEAPTSNGTAAAGDEGQPKPDDGDVQLFPPTDAGTRQVQDDGNQSPDPVLFADVGPPSSNPEPKFVAPWPTPDPGALPADVPTVVTPARPVEHEGWYVMSPPRGSANAVGVSDIEVGELEDRPLEDDMTLLSTAVRNKTARALLTGELHVMLLDSSGRVFAETYMPLVMLGPGAEQEVALAIPTRYWERKRGVRTGTTVRDWGESLSPVSDVALDPVGAGPYAALRISARHRGEAALRGALILIEAADSRGGLLRRYVVDNEKLYVGAGEWLDLVVQTPLDSAPGPVTWTALVQPR